MILKDGLDRAGPIVDRVNAAIRDNPLAAGLIGAGLAWMLMGGAKGFGVLAGGATGAAKGAASMARSMAGSAAATAATNGSTVANGVSNASSAGVAQARDWVSDIAGSVALLVPSIPVPDADKAFAAVSNAGTAIGDRLNSVAASGREYGVTIQTRLSESLEKQPLLLGAIGLAIGAGIASTFATTTIESELMGEQGAVARETLQDFASEVTDRAKKVASDVKDEATRQGLTVDTARNAAAGMSDKVKSIAGAGRESVTQGLSKP